MENVFGFTEVWPIIHLVWYMQVMIFFAKLWQNMCFNLLSFNWDINHVSLYMRTVCTVVVGYAYCQLIQCHGLWHHEMVYVCTCTTACDCMCCHAVPACPPCTYVRTSICFINCPSSTTAFAASNLLLSDTAKLIICLD